MLGYPGQESKFACQDGNPAYNLHDHPDSLSVATTPNKNSQINGLVSLMQGKTNQ